MKSSTFRFMDALLPFRCCSMLIPVKKVKTISARAVGFIAGLSASTFLAIRSLRKARLLETISRAAGGSTENWFMELTEKQPFWPPKLQGPSFRKRSLFFQRRGLGV